MYFTKASFLALCAATASAYSSKKRTFAVNHFYGSGPLVMGRMDPIISPGVAAGHVHAIQGGNAFALTMTDDQALKSTCTSSRVKNDKSNYWTPAMYFKDPKTGEIEPVELFYMNVYYFFDATTDHIEAFPEGLRIFTGNPSTRSPPATGGRQIIDHSQGVIQPAQVTCPRTNPTTPLYPPDSDGLHGVGIGDPNNKGSGAGFPDRSCDGYASPMRMDIHLPSCYNPAKGVQNYKENMDYPTNGNCPAGWKHVPHMFYEVYWDTLKFQDRWTQGQGNQPFVLANGDQTGYSFHADFINGWDPATLQQIIDNCDAGSAGMDKCPGLIGGVYQDAPSCNIESPIMEALGGVMDKLPGNNPIAPFGQNATPGSPAAAPISPPQSSKSASVAAPTTIKPASTTSKAAATSFVTQSSVVMATVTAPSPVPTSVSTVAKGWSYKGCFTDSKSRALSGILFANVGNKAVTSTKCVAYCDQRGFSMAGTEYGGQCFCGNALVGSTSVDKSKCNKPCDGDKSQACGGSMMLSVYSKSDKKVRDISHLRRHLHRLT